MIQEIQFLCEIDMQYPDLNSYPLWKFVSAETIFHTSLEESLELPGHILIGCALLFATRKYSGS
jgi:hypothetical protein